MSSATMEMRFADETALLAAVRAARVDGCEIVDVYTPYPVHGLDAAMGLSRSRLPLVAFAAGVVGLISAMGFQVYVAAFDWPLDVGGKPLNSAMAFVPITFEITVLLSGLAAVAAFLVRCRLFPGARPVAVDGVTLDAFVLMLRVPEHSRDESRDGAVERAFAPREEVLR